MIRVLATFALLLSVVPSCWAAQLDITAAPTADLPGYTTYKLFLALEGAEILRGIDADFRGSMNQINPAGNSTVFHKESWPWAIIPPPLHLDSHFWFQEQQSWLTGASESNTNLTATFSGLAALPPSNPALLAKIVTNDPASVSYHLEFDLGGGDPVVFGGFLAVPEPVSSTIAIGLFSSMFLYRRRG